MKKFVSLIIVMLLSFIQYAFSSIDKIPEDMEPEYSNLVEIKNAGKDAEGKYALLKVKLVAVSQKTVTLIDIERNYMKINFKRDQVKDVRSIRRNLLYNITVLIRFVYSSGIVEYDFVKAEISRQ